MNELVENEVSGMVINDEASKTESSLSEAIIRLLKDATLREELGKSAKKQAKLHYSFDQIGTSYIQTIEEAMQRVQARVQLKTAGWSRYDE